MTNAIEKHFILIICYSVSTEIQPCCFAVSFCPYIFTCYRTGRWCNLSVTVIQCCIVYMTFSVIISNDSRIKIVILLIQRITGKVKTTPAYGAFPWWNIQIHSSHPFSLRIPYGHKSSVYPTSDALDFKRLSVALTEQFHNPRIFTCHF